MMPAPPTITNPCVRNTPGAVPIYTFQGERFIFNLTIESMVQRVRISEYIKDPKLRVRQPMMFGASVLHRYDDDTRSTCMSRFSKWLNQRFEGHRVSGEERMAELTTVGRQSANGLKVDNIVSTRPYPHPMLDNVDLK